MPIRMRRLLECCISRSPQKSKVKNRDVGRNGATGLKTAALQPHAGVVNGKVVLQVNGERIKRREIALEKIANDSGQR
jgi:hypothetical protein